VAVSSATHIDKKEGENAKAYRQRRSL